MNNLSAIISKAAYYVKELFEQSLPIHLVFHSLEHTQNVVKGVQELCKHLTITKQEKQILVLAAWFHDCGHTITYTGHEAVSQAIAYQFLSEQKVDIEVVSEVMNCIEATKMPQRPKNLLQQIICDADLYHLSFTDYDDYEYLLRVEWDLILNQTYTDEEWRNLNIVFLAQHRYYTPYAKKKWEKRKRLNLQVLREQGEKKLRQTT
ncbi:MAG: HD domain-containing protein [Chitinophagales bacterium]